MNSSKFKKLILFVAIPTIVIIIYLKYVDNEKYLLLSTDVQLEEPEEEELILPLTWKETDEKLFDLDFEYVIKSHICDGNNQEITAVIIVTSYFGNVELRSAMRRSFSSRELLENFKLLRVFLLGLPHSKETYVTQTQVENEAGRFGDIVQGNFQEAYRNLTYKHLMGLLWASDKCKDVKYIMKMDDDIVVNIHKLQTDIIAQYLRPRKRFLAGFQLNEGPVRNSSSKWYVSTREYPSQIYPPYLSGWFYITTTESAKKIVHTARKMKYFWIDDVFLTGIVANRLKIKHFKLNYFYAMNHLDIKCCMEETKTKNISCKYIFGPNGGDNNLFYHFNSVMKKCGLNEKACLDSANSKCEQKDYKPKNFERIDENGGMKNVADGVVQMYKL